MPKQQISTFRNRLAICVVALLCVFLPVRDSGAESKHRKEVVIVPVEEIKKAMLLQTGYDVTATTNVARFQAEVILTIARKARARYPQWPLLLVRHDDWFRAFLEVNGLSEETAPLYARLAYQHQQNQLIDYHLEEVISKVDDGTLPEVALNVQVSWPDEGHLPEKYSFKDTLSTPKLQVTNHRVITYRLLDFGDMIVYDQIQGLTGRPLTGLLAMLFKLIGEGRVVWSKIAISEDGLQVNRAKAKKGPFTVTETLTVWPDGATQKGLPGNRPELVALEDKLKRPLHIQYNKWTLSDVDLSQARLSTWNDSPPESPNKSSLQGYVFRIGGSFWLLF